MKIEYDATYDLLYVYFKRKGTLSARTETLKPGIMVDWGADDELLGIEILDASTVLGEPIRFEGFETSDKRATPTPSGIRG